MHQNSAVFLFPSTMSNTSLVVYFTNHDIFKFISQ